jgi:hypothetical protein
MASVLPGIGVLPRLDIAGVDRITFKGVGQPNAVATAFKLMGSTNATAEHVVAPITGL